jgi:hypothetical protein
MEKFLFLIFKNLITLIIYSITPCPIRQDQNVGFIPNLDSVGTGYRWSCRSVGWLLVSCSLETCLIICWDPILQTSIENSLDHSSYLILHRNSRKHCMGFHLEMKFTNTGLFWFLIRTWPQWGAVAPRTEECQCPCSFVCSYQDSGKVVCQVCTLAVLLNLLWGGLRAMVALGLVHIYLSYNSSPCVAWFSLPFFF